MISEATALAKQGKAHYIEEQGAQYEGLTVWFNSMVDSAGGQILTPANKVVLGAPTKTAAAIMHAAGDLAGRRPLAQRLDGGIGTGGFPERVRGVHDQLPVRLLGDPGRESEGLQRHGVRTVPRGQPRRGAARVDRRLQPRRLGVLPHADLAFRALQCLTQSQNQARDAIKGGLAPVASSIYDQAAFDKAYPFHQLIKQQLQTYGIRPQTPAYADVTLAIQKALSPTSNINPTTVVNTLSNEIKLSLSSAALL